MSHPFFKRYMCGRLWSTAVLTMACLSGCVTINIYFPAAAAEKAADKVIDEIWQLPAGQSVPAGSSQASPPAPGVASPSNENKE